MSKIDYNSQQFKWAEEIMKEKGITILDINWNKFKTKKQIEEFIDMLEKSIKELERWQSE